MPLITLHAICSQTEQGTTNRSVPSGWAQNMRFSRGNSQIGAGRTEEKLGVNRRKTENAAGRTEENFGFHRPLGDHSATSSFGVQSAATWL